VVAKKYLACFIVFLTFLFGYSFCSIACAQEEKPTTPTSEQAEEAKPTVSASLTFCSQYIWRGYALSKDSLVIFPSITVEYKGFAVNMWGDLDTNYFGRKQWVETDWGLTYSNSFNKLYYTLGYIVYDSDGGDSQEVYVILGYPMPGNPSLSVWREIQNREAYYINLAFSQNFPFPVKSGCMKDWSIDVGGWVSYMIDHTGLIEDTYKAWHDANMWAALNIPLNNYFTLVPSINYSFPMSEAARENIELGGFTHKNAQFVYGGCTLKVDF
jgi:hypothetical protein